jgi:predicted secreted Zn-dependent protease
MARDILARVEPVSMQLANITSLVEQFKISSEQNYRLDAMIKEKQQLFSYINREEPSISLGGHIKQLIDLISPLHVTSFKLDNT